MIWRSLRRWVFGTGWSKRLIDDPSLRQIYVDRDLSKWNTQGKS